MRCKLIHYNRDVNIKTKVGPYKFRGWVWEAFERNGTFLAPFISKVAQPQPLNRFKRLLYKDETIFFTPTLWIWCPYRAEAHPNSAVAFTRTPTVGWNIQGQKSNYYEFEISHERDANVKKFILIDSDVLILPVLLKNWKIYCYQEVRWSRVGVSPSSSDRASNKRGA